MRDFCELNRGGPVDCGESGSRTGEGGFVLVLALLVMVILTLLGTLSMQIANTEVLAAGNKESSLASFYLLEGVAAVGVAHLENQNVSGGDCADTSPAECLVKALYNVESTALGWLDETYSEDLVKAVFDLSVTDSTAAENDSIFPRIRKFPDNWYGVGQHTSRVPDNLRVGNRFGLEPPGYVDVEEGGDDLIRFAVQDNGRIGAYSIGSDDPIFKKYKIYGLYYVITGGSTGYQGQFAVETGYRMELERMEIL